MKNNLPNKKTAKVTKVVSPTRKTAKKAPASKAKGISAKAAQPKVAAAGKAVTLNPTTVKPVTAPKAKKVAQRSGSSTRAKPVTTFVAQAEIGWGNSLYLRGEGSPELSWERGVLMKWEDGSWVYSTTGAKAPVAFKFLINDQIWAEGQNQHVEAGATSITTPHFSHH